jgi:hypothetical protein
MIRKFLSDNIPELFQSYDTNEPFAHCSMCERKLLLEDRYAVEKVVKQNKVLNKSEIVYEYAICWDCVNEMSDDISEESKASILNLYESYNNNVAMKLDYLHRTEKYNIESWTERCTFTGKEIRLCNEFSVSGIIDRGGLLYEHSPMVVSDEFMEEMQGVLSKETKDSLNGLRDKILDGSPSLEDIINTPTIGIF